MCTGGPPSYYVRVEPSGAPCRQYEHYLPILERHPLDVLDVMGTYGSPQRDNELKRIVQNANNFAAKYMCDRAIALYFRKVGRGVALAAAPGTAVRGRGFPRAHVCLASGS